MTGLSLGGGAEIQFSGEEWLMDSTAASNAVVVDGTINGVDVKLPLTALSENDQFLSAPAEGKLTYKLPSVMTIFNKEFDDFNGITLPVGGTTSSTLEFFGSVSTTTQTVACPSATLSNCKI